MRRSLLLLAASTSSTSGDNDNEREDNCNNLHRWMLPPIRALALHLNTLLYLTGLLTAYVAPLGHTITELGMRSALMANYVDNGKWQDWAADDTCHVSMCECTSWCC